MPKHTLARIALVVGSAAATLALQKEAEACGGCFVPPEDATVVTDHRMILAVGQGQSTLYDQIRYQGLPQEFAWVLPIAGDAEVGLSADVLFSTIGGFTQTQIIAPPRNCPSPPASCFERALSPPPTPGLSDAGSAAPGGVTVTREENVGPYATVQLQAEDPDALNAWLAANNFSIPADIRPTIAAYVREHFNFLALKLRPGASVQSMRPVRVTTKGPQVVLPLRMVAAGTGPIVGITLWVVGQGRYEPQNFPTFAIKADELSWDWIKSESNYKALRAQRTAERANRGWELESAFRLPVSQIVQPIQRSFGPASGDYAEQPASGTTPAKSADQVREEDLDVVFNKTRAGDVLITRLRSDLAHAALTEDLVLAASRDQGVLSNVRQVTREVNEPICPVYEGCTPKGEAPRSEAGRLSTPPLGTPGSSTAASSTSCATSPRVAEGGALAALALVAGVASARAARRRRDQPRP